MSIILSHDPALLQFDRIHSWLTSSYWAGGIERDLVERAFAGSRPVGAYRDGKQIGVARAITDDALFAWITDVFVAEGERGQGLGRDMVRYLLALPGIDTARRVMLATRDAHGVYAKLGFVNPQRTDFFMERLAPGVAELMRDW